MTGRHQNGSAIGLVPRNLSISQIRYRTGSSPGTVLLNWPAANDSSSKWLSYRIFVSEISSGRIFIQRKLSKPHIKLKNLPPATLLLIRIQPMSPWALAGVTALHQKNAHWKLVANVPWLNTIVIYFLIWQRRKENSKIFNKMPSIVPLILWRTQKHNTKHKQCVSSDISDISLKCVCL